MNVGVILPRITFNFFFIYPLSIYLEIEWYTLNTIRDQWVTYPVKFGAQQQFSYHGTMVLFWVNSAPFWPILFSLKKWLHHMKHVMVCYLHAKNYRKRSNSSKDIAVWEIERTDWSRAFKDIPREQEFSRTCGFHRKLVNQKTLRFKPFLA